MEAARDGTRQDSLGPGRMDSRNAASRPRPSPTRMKQTKHNQKIINWHRGLQPQELRASYLRANRRVRARKGLHPQLPQGSELLFPCLSCHEKHSVAEFEALFVADMAECMREAAIKGRIEGEQKGREVPLAHCLEDDPTKNQHEWASHRWMIGRRLFFQNPLPLPEDFVVRAPRQAFESGETHSTRVLERQLAQSMRYLMDPFGRNAWQRHGAFGDMEGKIKRALGFENLRCAADDRAAQLEICIQFLAWFAGYAIRKIEDWEPGSGSFEEEIPRLARHLFCKYSVPSWLDGIWVLSLHGTFYMLKHRILWAGWFLCMGQGGSLSTFARLNGFLVSERMMAHLHAAPSNLTPDLASLWALVMATCGNGRVAHWICNTTLAQFHVNAVRAREDGPAFLRMWDQTVRWIARYESSLTDDEAFEILDWAFTEYDRRAKEQRVFSWSGRTLKKVREQAHHFFCKRQKLLKSRQMSYWNAGTYAWSWLGGSDGDEGAVRWEFVELNTSFLMWEEGNAMRHCAGGEGYQYLCEEMDCCLISLTRNGVRAVTIEINGSSLQVEQVKGRFNREPLEEELGVIQRWRAAVLEPLIESRRVRKPYGTAPIERALAEATGQIVG